MVAARRIDGKFLRLALLRVFLPALALSRAFIGPLPMAVRVVFDAAVLGVVLRANLRFLAFSRAAWKSCCRAAAWLRFC